MTFEQSPNLNRYLATPIPIDWNVRWRLFKRFLPITFFCAFFIVQAILLRTWISDSWSAWVAFRIFVVVAILPTALIFHFELGSWLQRKRKKIIRLERNYVQFGSGLAQRVSWPNIVAWQFNNLVDEKIYRVATMEYKWGGKLRLHTIVLENWQADQLISELKTHQSKEAFSISDDAANFIPKPFELKRVRASKFYLYSAGVFLLIEGLPFLLIGLGIHNDSPNPIPVKTDGSFAKFIRTHFSSVAELRHSSLVAGTILCGSGSILIIWSLLLDKEKGAA